MNRFLFLTLIFAYTSTFSQTVIQIDEARNIDQSKTTFTDKKYKSEIQQTEKLITALMKEKNIPGLSIAVAQKNAIIWAQGFGFSDLENKTYVKINSKFRIGSISKTLTSLAIGKLVETKKLQLDDDIYKYVPYFPIKKHVISVANLASHTAGIRDYNYNSEEPLSYKNYKSVEESIRIFKDDSLRFQPGTKHAYATYNYVLLSGVIEGATQKNFTDYMRDSIFTPLNLNNTTPDYTYDIIENRVRFYDKFNGTLINGHAVNNSNKWAGGGYLSTPLDLVKMCQSLLKGTFLSKKTVQMLWTPADLTNGQHTNYGIGWRIEKDKINRTIVHHGGSSIGGRAFVLIYPESELSIAVTSNLGDSFDQAFVFKVAEIFLKK